MLDIITHQIIQIITAVSLVVLVLIQSKGKGLSSTLSGSIGFYRSRRGLEKVIFIATIVFSVALVANSIAIILLG